MKRLILAWALFMTQAFAQSSATKSIVQLAGTDNYLVTVAWTASSSGGSVSAIALSELASTWSQLQGYWVARVVTIPGSPAPTNGYSITITTSNNLDITNATMSSLSSSAAQMFSLSTAPPITGVLTINLTGNSVNSAQGTIQLFVTRQAPSSGGGGGITGNLYTVVASGSGPGTWTVNGSSAGNRNAVANTAQQITLATLPAGYTMLAAQIRHTASCTGGTLSAVTASLGTSSAGTPGWSQYLLPFDVFQATGVWAEAGGIKTVSFSSASVTLNLTPTGDSLSNLTACTIQVRTFPIAMP